MSKNPFKKLKDFQRPLVKLRRPVEQEMSLDDSVEGRQFPGSDQRREISNWLNHMTHCHLSICQLIKKCRQMIQWSILCYSQFFRLNKRSELWDLLHCERIPVARHYQKPLFGQQYLVEQRLLLGMVQREISSCRTI